MIDIDKAVSALKCHSGTDTLCTECPYYFRQNCFSSAAEDVVTIIEAQKKAIVTLKQKLTAQKLGAMTPDEFAEKMKKIIEDTGGYEEAFHGEADDLMCELLVSLGYAEGVEIFKKQPKWYA